VKANLASGILISNAIVEDWISGVCWRGKQENISEDGKSVVQKGVSGRGVHG
jgi:hypothetical protein